MDKNLLFPLLAVVFVIGMYVGKWFTRNELLKPIKIELTQRGEAGYLPPQITNGVIIDIKSHTDFKKHGGREYFPTKYEYTYEINLSDYLKK